LRTHGRRSSLVNQPISSCPPQIRRELSLGSFTIQIQAPQRIEQHNIGQTFWIRRTPPHGEPGDFGQKLPSNGTNRLRLTQQCGLQHHREVVLKNLDVR